MRPTHLKTRYRDELSPRQVEVIRLVEAGLTNAEIAERLGITLDGAKYHVREIMTKLRVESREEAVAAWRSSGRRIPDWIAALGVLLGGARGVAVGMAVAAVVAGAVAIGLAATHGDDSLPSAAETETASPITPITTASPSAVPTTSLAACAGDYLTLETMREGDLVRVQLWGRTATGCLFEGAVDVSLQRVVSDPSPRLPPRANIARVLPVSLRLGSGANGLGSWEGLLAEWRWENWCAPESPHFWHVSAPGTALSVPVGDFPACGDENGPTTLASIPGSSALLSEEFSGSVPGCPRPDWLCEVAQRIEYEVRANGLAGIVQAGEPTRVDCGAPAVDAFEECRGVGEVVRFLYRVIFHGLNGPRSLLSPDDTTETLQEALGEGFELASVGCPVDPGNCSTFFVAFATGAEPRVVYLVYELASNREPVFVSAGISGDNAAVILGGGETIAGAGDELVRFVPFVRP
jgi:DNA-binding CsgD family transcriptional regulator